MANCCNNLLVVTGPAKERRRLARLWVDGDPVFNRILPQAHRIAWRLRTNCDGGSSSETEEDLIDCLEEVLQHDGMTWEDVVKMKKAAEERDADEVDDEYEEEQ